MAITSRKVFIDSSVLIAFIDRSDSNHPKAVRCFETLAQIGNQVYTSFQSVNETFSMLSREVGTSIALEFLQSILQSDIEMLLPQKADVAGAFRVLNTNREKQITFREALNATLMNRRNISQALTFTYWHNLYGTAISPLTS